MRTLRHCTNAVLTVPCVAGTAWRRVLTSAPGAMRKLATDQEWDDSDTKQGPPLCIHPPHTQPSHLLQVAQQHALAGGGGRDAVHR
jgi:hypothetical protein